jgi:RND family efflux transporter MFP subunit
VSRLRRVRVVLAGALAAAAAAASASEVDCLIEPWSAITVSSAVQDVVSEVLVDRGDRVQKGQVLARLESAVEEAAVEMARARATARGQVESSEARLRFAERKLARHVQLKEQNVVSVGDMDQHESAKLVAEAELRDANEASTIAALDLRRAEAVLRQRTIASPIDGVVVERILSVGEYADPPQILKLAQIDPLRVEVFAPLALFGRIQLGMKADVLPEAPVGGTHAATVTVVDPVIDAASGTFGVRLELPNPDWSLPAGLKCRVRFPVEPAVAAPSASPVESPEVAPRPASPVEPPLAPGG